MRVKRGGRSVKVEVRADGEGLVSHAVPGPHRRGRRSRWPDERAGSRARRPLRADADALAGVRDRGSAAARPADGGEALCDLATVRDQEALFGPVASDSTAYRLIEAIAAEPDGLERPLGVAR